jgi:transcriptional regulator with XRE-family HTH domain
MSKTWIERQTTTVESRRLYEQERLVLWATDSISEAMEQAGVSRSELAGLLGTSRANVTSLLSGQRNMTLRTLADVACVLGQRVEVVFEPLRQGEYVSAPVCLVRPFRPRAVNYVAAFGAKSDESDSVLPSDERGALVA